jgi:ribosomal-protein-alanine N-acetyltransferase
MTANYIIRPMTPMDIPEVAAIEVASYPYPWEEKVFQECLNVGYPGWVVEQDGKVQAYLLAMHVLDECHILNIAVAPSARKQGLAKYLLQYLIVQWLQQGVLLIFLEVRKTNLAAIRLYECLGFKQKGERKGYYPTETGEREDALLYTYSARLEPEL